VPWVGRKKIAFVPVHRPNAHPPDDPVPSDWPNEILRRVFFDPDPVTKADRSLRAYINKASSGRADLDGIVRPMQTIDQQDVGFGTVEPLLGPQLRAEGFDAAAIVMLGGPGAGTSQPGGFWARFVMREPLGTWAMELMHVLTGFADIRPVPGLVDSPHGEGDISSFDEMGSNEGMHPTAYTKAAIGWLDQSSIAVHSAGTARYDLHAVGLVQPPPSGRWSAVQIGPRVPIPYLMVEARLMVDQFESASQFEPGIRNEGVIVYRIQTTDPHGGSQNQKLAVFLLTANALTVGQTFTSDTGIKVKVLSAFAGGFSVTVNDPTHAIVPDVLNSPAAAAKKEVQDAGLVPHFSPGSLTNSYVTSQTPPPGTIVSPGSTVSMVLHKGPVP
jgi:PASTA domain-containing protein